MTTTDEFTTYLELRQSTETGEAGAGLSHSAEGLFLLHVLEIAARGEPKGIVTVLHDAGEHGGRYRPLAEGLTEAGWATALPDLRGHGRSEGERGHSRGMPEVLRDVEEVQNHLAYRLPEASKVLVGQGLGALYALSYALAMPGHLQGLVLLAPLLEPTFPEAAPRKALFGLVKKPPLPTDTVPLGYGPEAIAPEAAASAAWAGDEHAHGLISVRSASEALVAARAAKGRLGELKLPVLCMTMREDPVAAGLSEAQRKGLAWDFVELEGQGHSPCHASDQAVPRIVSWVQGL